MNSISKQIAQELNIQPKQVDAAVTLLDEGATVPFIARYRKEVTGSLDDTQLRELEDRLRYLRELQERRETVINSIREQDKLTPELETAIRGASTKTELEDLYLPYKPKRRTKGQIAIEAGLEPLADRLLSQPELDPEQEAKAFIAADKGVNEVKDALDGAKYILMERFSENAEVLKRLREYLRSEGQVHSLVNEAEKSKGEKFRDYFDYAEALTSVPSHRALAIFRGRNEGILNLSIVVPAYEQEVAEKGSALGIAHPCELMIAGILDISDQGRAADSWLKEVIRWTWKIKLATHLETELLGELREQAEKVAIEVFAANLKDLLLAAPAGTKVTMGLDPGLRTGVKVAVVDATGKVVAHTAIYPHAPKNQWEQALQELYKLCVAHKVELISIGNGTASRETDKLAAELISRHPELKMSRIMVSEAGASVYSASEFAAREFPDLDVTIRGAVSIARRLQDPLAELVKIEPKSIGVGQYQHDVSQVQLGRSLGAVVEDCVNAVGVDVNTASVPLLARVSGLNQTIADNIVSFRDQHGAFKNRQQLKQVSRLGERTFEQAAGFLRVLGGDSPLDASAVHPESYGVVEQMAQQSSRDVAQLIGDQALLRNLKIKDFISTSVGEETIKDIVTELAKPGRDPRPEFKFASYQEGVEEIRDLKPDMVLEGTVTNVTHFGAFVDIGVHQDGLVHISALADRFVKDPREVVKTGDIVKVKVMEVDAQRKRIALSMRMGDKSEQQAPADPRSASDRSRKPGGRRADGGQHARHKPQQNSAPMNNAMAAAFAKASRK